MTQTRLSESHFNRQLTESYSGKLPPDIRSAIRLLWKRLEDKREIERKLHRFYLACARRLFPLLPQLESRESVALGEKYLAGSASLEELREYDWHSEAAVFIIEYDEGSEDVAAMISDVQSMPRTDLVALLNGCDRAFDGDVKRILYMTAYFANFAMIYPFMKNRGTVSENYTPFLSSDLFDEHFGDQFPAE